MGIVDGDRPLSHSPQIAMSKKKKSRTRTSVGTRTPSGGMPAVHIALQQQFAVWYRKHAAAYDEHPDPDSVRSVIAMLFDTAAARRLSLLAPTVEILDTVLGDVADDDKRSTLEMPSLEVLSHYLQFLDETNQWVGSEDDYSACRIFITGLLDSLDDED
jgi:hypothetical protein